MRNSGFLLLLLATPLYAADPAWIEYAPGNAVVARTIVTSGGACPPITINGTASAMTQRAASTSSYPVTVCEATLPSNVTAASIGATTLPVQKLGQTTKIAVIGDTGCRIKAKKGGNAQIQDCSDPTAWPFAQIAASVAAWNPDLVVHVGDYYYREYDCTSPTNCSGPTYNWTGWNADFFTPAAPLLANAPWVVVRGNHEICSRAAEGWFRFLDGAPFAYTTEKACEKSMSQSYTAPYQVSTGGMQFLVFDSSFVDDKKAKSDQKKVYAAELTELRGMQGASPNAWLLLHHPMWAVRQGADDDEDELEDITDTLQKAWAKAKKTPKVNLIVTGHVHLVQALDFTDGRMPQLVLGNGGTQLEKPLQGNPDGQTLDGRTVSDFITEDQFGFAAVTPITGGWSFSINSPAGAPQIVCSVQGGKTNCAPK